MNFISKFLKYKSHPEAIVISCFFNPQNSPYRLSAFKTFYKSIKHLNHRIVECVIGDGKSQLETTDSIEVIRTPSLLWHKEAILNYIVKNLDPKYKYVFWVDADVLFTNRNWLVDSVDQLSDTSTCRILQPFEYCIHLNQDELKPDFDVEEARENIIDGVARHKQMWRSFCANFVTNPYRAKDTNYDKHGHVGFAWGARRDLLDTAPLYDKALIGGADHIIAHAAAGHIPHRCISNAFKDDLDAILKWSQNFLTVARGRIGFVSGDLYHIWHGDIEKRQYLKRIQDFTVKTKNIQKKDANGLYVTHTDDPYVKKYFDHREVKPVNVTNVTNITNVNQSNDGSFIQSAILGYATDSAVIGGLGGGDILGGLAGQMIRDITQDTPAQNDAPAPALAPVEPNSTPPTDATPIELEAPETPHTNDVSENFS